MASIEIGEFRANMGVILQRVQQGEAICLLLGGKEIAKLVPPNDVHIAARQSLKELRQTTVIGDILSLINETWDADSSELSTQPTLSQANTRKRFSTR